MDWRSVFLSSKGRMGRKDNAIGYGIILLVGLLTSKNLIGWLWLIAAIYFLVCLYAKRLHDIGQSAVTILIPFGLMVTSVPFAFFAGVGSFFTIAAQRNQPNLSQDFEIGIWIGLAILVVTCLVVSWILVPIGLSIWLGLAKGSTKENEFGPPLIKSVTPETP
jgi:uncharacterized membrane protein YhaH (DUF805 family)